jgi:nitronate monooxygenase
VAVILQVTDLEEARQAVDLGADVIVAQGTESGGRGQDTERSGVSDIARGSRWPSSKYTARVIGHPSLDQWLGREAEFAVTPEAQLAYQAAVVRGDVPSSPVWASEAIDLINDLPPAADLVTALAAQAETALARAGKP